MAAAWALTAWYIWACAANWAAVSADTSSAAAGTTPVVGAAAAAFWALNAEPIPCKLPAAAASASGWVVTKDILVSSSTFRLDDLQGMLFAAEVDFRQGLLVRLIGSRPVTPP